MEYKLKLYLCRNNNTVSRKIIGGGFGGLCFISQFFLYKKYIKIIDYSKITDYFS